MQTDARHQSRGSRTGIEKNLPNLCLQPQTSLFSISPLPVEKVYSKKISVLTSKASPENLHSSQLIVSSAQAAW